ncbi:LysR family transcriptional regulator [Fulvivirgaceae bacterium BMA10]|uniref:LysR family transcriptional regulator n=1 Tax=Splendidivirga corallicola TaxID=3051826 RepID=A0ABT8KNK1_9BACT|nr:LysR family transcriptional regulator [Fulvivirgaceae bacterium BMA10]
MVEIQHLTLIDTVTRVGTLKKAVEELFLTQSALSHQLKELERMRRSQLSIKGKIGSPISGFGGLLFSLFKFGPDKFLQIFKLHFKGI